MKLQGRIADHQYGLSGLILQLGLAGEQREGLGTFLLLDGHQFAFSGERVAGANRRTHIEAHAAGKRLPLGRMQTVEDTAYAAIYLLSDESAQVTAAVLNVDAGGSMLPIQNDLYPG